MTKRRLRLHYSSSDEEDEQPPPPPPPPQPLPEELPLPEDFEEEDDIIVELQESTLDLQNVTLNPPNPNPDPSSAPPAPVHLEISDDEFVDVSENFLPPSPPPAVPPVTEQTFQSSSASRVSSDGSVDASGCPISDNLGRLGLRLRRQWLDSCLLALESSVPGFGSLDFGAKAKLCFEQFLFSDLNHCGAGVLPDSVHDMHLADLPGPFILQVDEIVNISCPLKGRYRNAPSGLKRCLKLSMTDGVQRVFGMEYRPIKDLEVLAPAGLKVAICNVHVRRGLLMLVPEVFQILGGVVENLEAARQRLVTEVNKPPRGKRTKTGVVPPLATRATVAAWPLDSANTPGQTNSMSPQAAVPLQAAQRGTESSISTRERTREKFDIHTARENFERNATSTVVLDVEYAVPNTRNAERNASPTVVSDVEDIRMVDQVNYVVPSTTEKTEPNASSAVVSDVEDIHMVDQVDHPLILRGDREIPFTYLASLSAKWTAMKDKGSNVKGKIKCFLTGVKGFQYKHRATFELHVYVDDGSLISEILIDHNVVQKGIGYSPQEVTAALTSQDKKKISDMKETLKRFQFFLANFEGTMVVQISEASPIPIAVEMNQGCPPSDAWLLLRKLQSSAATFESRQHLPVDPITLSP
ncbi:hypothetical protein NMG60_11004651 [Bertholletia excelsa]